MVRVSCKHENHKFLYFWEVTIEHVPLEAENLLMHYDLCAVRTEVLIFLYLADV